jgi:hypothetical protein
MNGPNKVDTLKNCTFYNLEISYGEHNDLNFQKKSNKKKINQLQVSMHKIWCKFTTFLEMIKYFEVDKKF